MRMKLFNLFVIACLASAPLVASEALVDPLPVDPQQARVAYLAERLLNLEAGLAESPTELQPVGNVEAATESMESPESPDVVEQQESTRKAGPWGQSVGRNLFWR